MVFSSLIFLYGFLPICLILYFLCRSIRAKNVVLTILSLLFYAWGEPVYVGLLILSAVVNYTAGRLIEKFRGRGGAKASLAAAVVLNLGVLVFFKYTGFLVENLNALTGLNLTAPAVTMPIGISFYTFQALSYVVDVYREKTAVQKSFPNFLLFISLFPQLIAGPIVRYSDVAAQITDRKSTVQGAFYGMTRFCMGLGKKVLLANYAGNVADTLLGGTLSLTATGDFWLGVIMFSFQIYFDFSGYSDMAIGLGHIFGFKYSENFNLPYLSKSASEFWRRWHISLGSFFRDYVYIPLGGNRRHQVLNLLVVWFLTGLWHGASWNFVLWGLYFFVLIALEKLAKPLLDKVPGILRWLVTVVLVEFSWVLFYFTDFGRLSEAILAAFGQNGASFLSAQTLVVLKNNLFLILVCILANSAVPRFVGMQLQVLASVPGKALKARENIYSVAVFLFCAALLVLSTIALVGNSYSPFLYFRY